MLLFFSNPRLTRMKRLLVVVVLAIATALVLPNYMGGTWAWETPPDLPQTSQLNRVKADGLVIPGWKTLEQESVEISGHGWSIQSLQVENADATADASEAPEPQAILLLRPQTWYRDQPQVEWMDLNGLQGWTTDHHRRLKFAVEPPGGSDPSQTVGDRAIAVSTRYFRGWNRQQTYAVLQWYAWSTGGSPNIGDWFWADQGMQLRDRHRMPWVAVSLLIPIKPLGDIESVRTTAESLSKTIQATLVHDVFTEPT